MVRIKGNTKIGSGIYPEAVRFKAAETDIIDRCRPGCGAKAVVRAKGIGAHGIEPGAEHQGVDALKRRIVRQDVEVSGKNHGEAIRIHLMYPVVNQQ